MGETTIQPDLIHSKECLGIPDYITYRSALYTAYKRMALDNDPHSPRVSLTHSTEHATTEEMNIGKSQIDAQWLFYDAQNRLSPNQFSTALAIRLNILSPSLFRAQIKCNCGETIQTSSDMIAHTLKCDQMSPVTHTTRHNMVRDAIVQTIRQYGITTSSEPRCFTYQNDVHQRPDIMAHTKPQHVVTDVTLIHEHIDITLAEKNKHKTHSEACAKQGCIFIPFAMYTRGTLGQQAEKFINTISKAILPSLQRTFKNDLKHAVSVAAAKARAITLLSATDRMMWQH